MDLIQPITVTIRNARKLSGLGNTTIYKMISSGELETVCVGRRRLIVVQSLEKRLRPNLQDAECKVRRRDPPDKLVTDAAKANSQAGRRA